MSLGARPIFLGLRSGEVALAKARAFSLGEFLPGRGALNPLNFYAGEEYGRASTRGTYHISVQGLTRAGFELV